MRRTTRLLAVIALLSGCSGEPTATGPGADVGPDAAGNRLANKPSTSESAASVQKDLATLRQVTARFHRFEAATNAGWSTKITPCMTDPAGGMGFHYGNTALIDAVANVAEPELLLYEPEKNGRLRLVAVEYIIPYTLHARDAAPPVLFGREFLQNDAFQLWGLHAWVWKHNPSGMFANWNPTVSCKYTTDVLAMAHN